MDINPNSPEHAEYALIQYKKGLVIPAFENNLCHSNMLKVTVYRTMSFDI